MKKILFFAIIITFLALIALSCKHSKKVSESKGEDSFIKNEIIVQLKKDASTRRVLESFKEYKLETIKAVNQEMNIWLFTYDTDLISSKEMLEKLKNSTLVDTAEYNKKVKLRGK